MTEQIKLCKDCKYSRQDFIFMDCIHPNLLDKDYVNGNHKSYTCKMMRDNYYPSFNGRCGPEGKYWEAK